MRQKLFAFKCAKLSLLVLVPLQKLWDQRGLVSATAAANDISYAHLHCMRKFIDSTRESKLKEREGERSIAFAAGATDAPAVVVVAGFVFRRV